MNRNQKQRQGPGRIRRGRRPLVEGLEERALLSAGDLDATLGGTGLVFTEVDPNSGGFGATSNYAADVAIQDDGRTVEVGPVTYTTKPNHLHMDAAVIRYNVDGSLDTTFGSGGQVNLPFDENSWDRQENWPHKFSLAVQSDGKIVVSGTTLMTYGKGKNSYQRYELKVTRLNPDGSLDTTFNGTGSTQLGIPQVDALSNGVVLQSDGRIVVSAGTRGEAPGFVVARWTTDGHLDTSFGPNGQGYNLGPPGLSASIAVDQSDRILIGGRQKIVDNYTLPLGVIVRYTADGLLDPTFDGDGELIIPSLKTTVGISGIGVQSSGRIVAAGPNSEQYVLWVVGVDSATGTVDPSFGASGYDIDPVFDLYSRDLAVQPDDKVVIGGPLSVDDITRGFWLTRVLASGSGPDTSFGDSGYAEADFGPGTSASLLSSLAIGPDNKITAVGSWSPLNDLNRFATARFLNDISGGASMNVSAPELMTGEAEPTGTLPDPAGITGPWRVAAASVAPSSIALGLFSITDVFEVGTAPPAALRHRGQLRIAPASLSGLDWASSLWA